MRQQRPVSAFRPNFVVPATPVHGPVYLLSFSFIYFALWNGSNKEQRESNENHLVTVTATV